MNQSDVKSRPRVQKPAICVAGLLLVFAGSAFAARPPDISESEMRSLPSWCPDTQGFQYGYKQSPRAARWEQIFGDSFWQIHHYCWGIIYLKRAQAVFGIADKKLSLLSNALNDFDYSVKNSNKKIPIMPEIYLRKGETEVLLSEFKGYESHLSYAQDSFRRAREIKPDYWPAYSFWAEKLIKIGQKAEAKELVRTGLEHSPESKVLQDQYKALGGNLSDIKPIEASEPAASATKPIDKESNPG